MEARTTVPPQIEREPLFRRFFQHSRDLLCIATPDAILRVLNPAWERVFGWDRSDLLDRSFLEFLHEEDVPLASVELDRLIAGADTVSFDTRFRTRDGRWRWLSWNAHLHKGEMLAVARDVTDEKLRESRLEQANQDLAAFAHAAAHDLKKPLRHVAGNLEIFVEDAGSALDALPPDVRGRLDRAIDGAHRLDRMIDGMLKFARAGRVDTSNTVDLGELFKIARTELGEELERLGGTAIVLDDPPMLDVVGDARLLLRVLQNLLSNAMKFRRPNTPPHITFSCRGVDGHRAIFAFEDNGIGIDAKFSSEIFYIFRRLHPPSQYEGTGLGLALVRRIIEAHGGEVWLEEHEGPGAHFLFSLPVV